METITEKVARRDMKVGNPIVNGPRYLQFQKEGSLLFYDTPDNKTHFFKLDEKWIVGTRHEITEEEYYSLDGCRCVSFNENTNHTEFR